MTTTHHLKLILGLWKTQSPFLDVEKDTKSQTATEKESTAALEGSASYRPYQLCSEESLSLEPSWQLWAEAEEHLHTVLRMQLGEVRDGTSDMFTSSALPISCSFTFEADWRSLGRPQPSHALYKGSSNALSSSRWDSASPRGWQLLDLGLLSQNIRATSSLKNIYDVWL